MNHNNTIAALGSANTVSCYGQWRQWVGHMYRKTGRVYIPASPMNLVDGNNNYLIITIHDGVS